MTGVQRGAMLWLAMAGLLACPTAAQPPAGFDELAPETEGIGLGEEAGREYGYFYNPQTDAWEYGWHFDPYAGDYYRPEQFGYDLADSPRRARTDPAVPSYQFGYEVRGTIGEITWVRASGGQLLAAGVGVRTDAGPRRIQLGSAFLDPRIPWFRQGDEVAVSGRQITLAGQSLFKVAGIARVDEGPLYPWRNEQVLRGRITDYETLYVVDGRPRAVRLELQTEDGDARELLLGTAASMLDARVRLSAGTDLVARGFVEEAEGGRTFVAQRIATDAGWFAGDDDARRRTAAERTSRRAAEPRASFVRGQLLAADVESVDGADHLIAQVEEFDGRVRTVNLGSLSELEPLNLRPGDRVIVLGFPAPAEGRSVLTARYVRLREHTAAVNRQAVLASGAEGADLDAGGDFLAGEIAALKPLEQQGDRTEMLALVELDAGGTAEVLLGTRTRLEPLNLRVGSEILVHGFPTRREGRAVLEAHHVQAGNQTVAVGPAAERERRSGRSASAGRAAQAAREGGAPRAGRDAARLARGAEEPGKADRTQVKRYTGEVLEVRPASFVDFAEPHLLARVRMRTTGEEVSVDLGPQSGLAEVAIERGDLITVRGPAGEINGAEGLVAYELTLAGRRISIAQPEKETKASQRE